MVAAAKKSVWKPVMLIRIHEMARKDLTDEEIALALGVAPATFASWKKKKPEVQDALSKARGLAIIDMGRFPNLLPQQQRFLVAYSTSGVLTAACEATGISREKHKIWLEQEAYKTAFEDADQEASERLVIEARRRAVDGVIRLKFHQGMPIMVPCEKGDPGAIEMTSLNGNVNYLRPYEERQYSDNLLTKLLEAYRPEFRDKKEISLSHSGSILIDMLEATEIKRADVIDEDFVDKAAQKFIESVKREH